MTDAQYRQAEAIEQIRPLVFPSADYLRRIILGPPVMRLSPAEEQAYMDSMSGADDRDDRPQEDQPCEQC